MATLLAGDINLGRTATIASIALCGAVFAAKYAKHSTAKLPLPPGPSGLPLIGNVLDAPAENFWLRYKEWSDQYG
jgi:fumitremorgin C synthase